MRIHALYDETGEILAAIRISEDPTAGRLRPMPKEGQMCADFDIPQECCHLDFLDLCQSLSVDMEKQTLIWRQR